MDKPNKIEKLDVNNIIEVQQMRQLLKDHKGHNDLLALFECLMKIINDRLNNEGIYALPNSG
tara:strand:- start:317 stop:502 length:186 start_codon:yes stop_codon:yes gene_type:complete